MKKIISIVLVIVVTLSLGTATFAAADGWQRNNSGWWYRNADGTYPKGCWLYDAGKAVHQFFYNHMPVVRTAEIYV